MWGGGGVSSMSYVLHVIPISHSPSSVNKRLPHYSLFGEPDTTTNE